MKVFGIKKLDKDVDKVLKKIKIFIVKNFYGSLCFVCGFWLIWWMIVECFNNSYNIVEKKIKMDIGILLDYFLF